MCLFVPHLDTGGLPNLTFIIQKPEPLGTEMKCVIFPKTGIMLGLEIQCGNQEMKSLEFHKNWCHFIICGQVIRVDIQEQPTT